MCLDLTQILTSDSRATHSLRQLIVTVLEEVSRSSKMVSVVLFVLFIMQHDNYYASVSKT